MVFGPSVVPMDMLWSRVKAFTEVIGVVGFNIGVLAWFMQGDLI